MTNAKKIGFAQPSYRCNHVSFVSAHCITPQQIFKDILLPKNEENETKIDL